MLAPTGSLGSGVLPSTYTAAACLPTPCRRLEGAKQALEGEIKELRKAAKEEMSELKLEQNSAKQVRRGARREGRGLRWRCAGRNAARSAVLLRMKLWCCIAVNRLLSLHLPSGCV